MTPDRVTRRFLDGHLARHPEEASTLGVRDHDARLSDPGREAACAELVELREVLAELDGVDGVDGVEALDAETRIDHDAIRRFASFHVRRIEQDSDAENLELALLPSAALQHAALHARREEHWLDLAARARAVPAFLAAHAENLRRGVSDGRAPDDTVTRTFVDRLLPATAASLLTLADAARGTAMDPEIAERVDEGARAASDAYHSFQRFVSKIVLPVTRDDVRLGEQEVTLRLREAMGLEHSIAELVAMAREELGRARAVIDTTSRAMGFLEPRDAIREVLGRRPATLADALALYRTNLDAATRFVVARELVPIVPAHALDLAPLPAGIADGSAVTNWPAPLLDPEGRGHILYEPHVAPHASVATKNLAVHEGIPGHYLQSVAWQRAMRGRDRARAVRFLGVSDHVAMARAYYGAMVSVEGWAVSMEQLLFEQGFYEEGAETLFFAVCDAIRATRVLLDLEVHAGGISLAAAKQLIEDETRLPDSWATWQVLRAKRMPLQGLTYLVGAREHADLRAARPQGESLLAFHARVLEAGPVPLSRLRESATKLAEPQGT